MLWPCAVPTDRAQGKIKREEEQRDGAPNRKPHRTQRALSVRLATDLKKLRETERKKPRASSH